VTFFQQVGGTVGLAITGTVFATSMTRELPAAIGSAGIPPQVGQALAAGGGLEALMGVGNSGAALLASLAPGARGLVEPFMPAIVGAMHAAFSISTGSTFTLGIATTVVAAGLVLLLREAPAGAVASQGSREPEDEVKAEEAASAA
jgi:hypothetical protein